MAGNGNGIILRTLGEFRGIATDTFLNKNTGEVIEYSQIKIEQGIDDVVVTVPQELVEEAKCLERGTEYEFILKMTQINNKTKLRFAGARTIE